MKLWLVVQAITVSFLWLAIMEWNGHPAIYLPCRLREAALRHERRPIAVLAGLVRSNRFVGTRRYLDSDFGAQEKRGDG